MFDEFALLRFAGDDCFSFERDLAVIEPQFGLAIVFVVAVTNKAVFRKDGSNISIELNFIRCCGSGGNADQHQRQGRNILKRSRHIEGKIQTQTDVCVFVRTLVLNAMNDSVTATNLTKE